MAKLEDLPVWGAKEVAQYFRISESSVWELARIPKNKGGPPVWRIGRIVRFPTQEFLDWAKGTKPFRSIRPASSRKRKKNVQHDNRVRRVVRAVDAAV